MEAQLTQQGEAADLAPPAAPPAGRRVAPPPAPPTARKPKRHRTPLEQRIGQSWTAWVGAIVIVIAISACCRRCASA
jgi:uncharacterized membrane protein